MRTSSPIARRALLLAVLATALSSSLVVACGGGGSASSTETVDAAISDAGPPDAFVPRVPGPPKRLFAKRFVVKVHERPDRESSGLGYLRAGSVVQGTTDIPVATEGGCRGGWFELTTGGFVCEGRDVTAFLGKRPPARGPAQPDFDEPLPYRYGRTRRGEQPMYRRLPSDEEAAQYEGYRIPGLEPPPVEPGAEGEAPAPVVEAEVLPASGVAATAADEGALEDLEPVVPTLDSLRGERGGVLIRRMMPGFIVSVDRDMRARARRYWRTLSNGFVPYRALGLVQGSEFQGTALDETHTLPVGFVLSSKVSQSTRGRDGRLRRGRRPGYHAMFFVSAEEDIRDAHYLVTPEGPLYREDEVRVLRPIPRPEGVGESDKWIDVDLEHQTLVAYEGDRPVYATLISSGRVRDPEDPLRDHRTPTGLFQIRSKYVTHTMDGDHAADGPYSIEDVPYVMYFQLAFALHSAFWHDGFGRPRSHGCVNLAPLDARWIFGWAGPTLPAGWHAVYPNERNPATWVYVHGETPEG